MSIIYDDSNEILLMFKVPYTTLNSYIAFSIQLEISLNVFKLAKHASCEINSVLSWNVKACILEVIQ